jgi:hypothetical protein
MTNPTQHHLEHADDHRLRAAEHRAASQTLRDAENRACAGIPDDDRDESPFDHPEDITSVTELYSLWSAGDSTPTTTTTTTTRRIEGATILFRAVPGLTAPWLQRVVDCHLARNAALGFDVPEMAHCPLVLKGITASVSPAQSGGFAITIKSDDPAVAREVFRRARSSARVID